MKLKVESHKEEKLIHNDNGLNQMIEKKAMQSSNNLRFFNNVQKKDYSDRPGNMSAMLQEAYMFKEKKDFDALAKKFHSIARHYFSLSKAIKNSSNLDSCEFEHQIGDYISYALIFFNAAFLESVLE